MRRVRDLALKRNCGQMCLNRGTIVIYGVDETTPELRLTTFGMKKVFKKLKDAWTKARVGTAIDMSGAD